jgi:hypothetical protein
MKLLSNPFFGVNPLLMSLMQGEESYAGFHGNYASYLTGHLNQVLPLHYQARTEDSIMLLGTDFQVQTRYPDVLIEQLEPHSSQMPALSVVAPSLELDYEPEASAGFPKSVLIEALFESTPQPITVIEILSPSNKTSHRQEYRYKRQQLLSANLALVEVDWLHESPSVIPHLPPYPRHPKASPYHIAVTNPRLSAKTQVYQVQIEQALPQLALPLLGQETVPCDFEAVYQETFLKGRYGNSVDYRQAPPRLASYAPHDQEKIRAAVARILQETP